MRNSKERLQKNSQKKFGKKTVVKWILALAIMAGLSYLVLFLMKDKDSAETPAVYTIAGKDWVITGEQAYDYAAKTIGPILVKHANDPNEVPGIRNRIVAFSNDLQNHRINYKALGAYAPVSKDLLAKVDYDPAEKMRLVLLFVPAAQDLQRKVSSDEFENTICIVFAHERIHIEDETPEQEIQRGRDNYLAAREESIAWGKTIIEMVRPLQQRGRKLPQWMITSSETLRKLNDNYFDPVWIDAVFKSQSF